jgi:hypothetical protein
MKSSIKGIDNAENDKEKALTIIKALGEKKT